MRERMNGLYGPGAYVLANSIVTLPYLFICVTLFSVLCYWSIGLNPGAEHFFRFLGVLFLAVYTAESQVRTLFLSVELCSHLSHRSPLSSPLQSPSSWPRSPSLPS